jgi:hypothetical protein
MILLLDIKLLDIKRFADNGRVAVDAVWKCLRETDCDHRAEDRRERNRLWRRRSGDLLRRQATHS